MAKKGRKMEYKWEGQRIRSLRKHLGLTQEEMAEELGVRQQTISEWETDVYTPRGASATLLRIVAERAGFSYGEPQDAKTQAD